MKRCFAAMAVLAAIGLALPASPAAGEKPVASKQVPAVASSTVKVQTKTQYGPDRLFDGNPATAWCEGAKGDGKGEAAAVYLGDAALMAGPQDVTFNISRGIQSSFKSYEENGRPTKLLIELFAGKKLLGKGEGATGNAFSEIVLKGVPAATGDLWFRVTILDVLPGSTWRDSCISEIRPQFAKANPHNGRDFARRLCQMVNGKAPEEGNAQLKALHQQVKKEFFNYDDDGNQVTRCDPEGIAVLSEDDFQMWAAEGGDGASILRFRRKGIGWELLRTGYFTALD